MSEKRWTHQKDANKSISRFFESDEQKGCVIAPTGSGKTFIQADAVEIYIEIGKEAGVVIVFAPRIALCYQLAYDYRKVAGAGGWNDKILPMIFNSSSEKMPETEDGFVVITSTSSEDVRKQYERAQRQGKTLIIFSTYHSGTRSDGERLLQSGIDFSNALVICDEAHNTVSEDFAFGADFPSRKSLFFTATPKHTSSSNGRGMNNSKRYGNIIFEASAKELIENNIIVRPRLHFAEAHYVDKVLKSDDEVLYSTSAKAIIDVLDYHENEVEEVRLPPKALVATKGTDHIDSLKKNKSFRKQLKEKGYSFCLISTNHGAVIDDKEVDRKTFFNHIKECERCVVLHYDIISEGIDIQGLTHLILFRGLSQTKLVQSSGRIMRTHPEDKNKTSLDEMLKPYAWIVPVILQGSDDDNAVFVSDIIHQLRLAGIEPEIYNEDNPKGQGEEEETEPFIEGEDVKFLSRKDIEVRFLHEIEEKIDHSICNSPAFDIFDEEFGL